MHHDVFLYLYFIPFCFCFSFFWGGRETITRLPVDQTLERAPLTITPTTMAHTTTPTIMVCIIVLIDASSFGWIVLDRGFSVTIPQIKPSFFDYYFFGFFCFFWFLFFVFFLCQVRHITTTAKDHRQIGRAHV